MEVPAPSTIPADFGTGNTRGPDEGIPGNTDAALLTKLGDSTKPDARFAEQRLFPTLGPEETLFSTLGRAMRQDGGRSVRESQTAVLASWRPTNAVSPKKQGARVKKETRYSPLKPSPYVALLRSEPTPTTSGFEG